MSGGHYNYQQYKIHDISRQLAMDIEKHKDTFQKSVVQEMNRGLYILRLAEVYAQRIDYLLSGDDGEESFIRRLKTEVAEVHRGSMSEEYRHTPIEPYLVQPEDIIELPGSKEPIPPSVSIPRLGILGDRFTDLHLDEIQVEEYVAQDPPLDLAQFEGKDLSSEEFDESLAPTLLEECRRQRAEIELLREHIAALTRKLEDCNE